MRVVQTREAKGNLLRPLVRAADGIVHNRERRRMINRYRRVACVALVPESDEQQLASRFDR